MPRLSLGLGIQTRRKIGSGGPAPITTSRAFNSSGGQVGSTNTGDIPVSWMLDEVTVTSVIFANDNSVTNIGTSSFAGCTSLASVSIPSSVTIIGDHAFQATPITSISIPSNVANIGSYAFYECYSLTSITIPNSVTSIENFTFGQCAGLTSVTFTPTSSVTSIGNSAFAYNTGLTSITIPNSVTSIGNYAFRACDILTSVTLGNGVTSIGSYAFYQCTNITSITIPNSVISIGSFAFGYTGLTSITIPNSVTSIGSYAFRNCTNLASVLCRVPQSAFIGSAAFYSTASPLVIQARITDTSWTAGVGLTFQGNTNVTVLKTL